ncbi:MAG: isoaspartyl peptidase/L-asparaginase, partial [Burkholderiales bacterium]|nr:isoaspartyl peptidase/L-asparaginase [Burkholderiales bacterium]
QNTSPEELADYHKGLEESLKAGWQVLSSGGSAVDAVVAAIKSMEDNPVFNAGKGAVFTSEGKNELDAAIMDGKTLDAGAVAGVEHIKNPIEAAYLVMKDTPHVLLASVGAEKFAVSKGIPLTGEEYFVIAKRHEQLKAAKTHNKISLDHDNPDPTLAFNDNKYGTVGAVALDVNGNLAAGTSTGGMTNKLPGRVGDSPIIGAGTYANNATAAISCTGTGEKFITVGAAQNIHDRCRFLHEPVEEAIKDVLLEVQEIEGVGGIIALDAKGNFGAFFNAKGMLRGTIGSSDPTFHTAVFGTDPFPEK